MSQPIIENVNLAAQTVLMSPAELKAKLPITEKAKQTIIGGRETINNILDRKDSRLMMVIGPCSIHDIDAAMDYARRLKALADQVKDSIYIVMRVYFEKPRTTVGWKGLINDPYLNGSFNIEEGLQIGRKLLIDIAELGLPTATEALDPISPQYLHDLISWSAIGARTTESQTHRDNGQVAIISTKGNQYGHVVLRGGGGKPNYDSFNIAICEQVLREAGVVENIMVDCSHENSNKNHALQPLVLENITQQIVDGNQSIMGVMVESNIGAGNQKILDDHSEMAYGVSVTDKCIDWETTENSLLTMHEKLLPVLSKR